MELATIDSHSQKEHTEIHKIPKFGLNQASFHWVTAIQKRQNLQRNVWDPDAVSDSVRIAIHFFLNCDMKLAWLRPNLGILWISVCSFWLCESIVANSIIYRLVPRPSRFDIRQWLAQGSTPQGSQWHMHNDSAILLRFSILTMTTLKITS